MIDMTKYTAVATYAEKHNMTEAQVIKEIKDGDLVGQLYRGAWFVKVGKHPVKDSYEAGLIADYLEAHRKSPFEAFVYALLLGPVGVLYGSPIGATALILLSLGWIATSMTAVFIDPRYIDVTTWMLTVPWLAGLFMGPWGAASHNRRIATHAAAFSPLWNV